MLRRLAAALTLLTFLAYGGWSESHPCEMHDGVLAQMAMASHQAMPHQQEMPGHSGTGHHCTCIGDCGAALATALPSAPLRWIPEVRARSAAVSAAATIAYVAIARAHARPWSTAPPRAARIA